MTAVDFKEKFFDKIQYQFKTLKKAFRQLDLDKEGHISMSELKVYLNNAGYVLTQDQFDGLYQILDQDQDGKISYSDFQFSAGKHITPAEHLYFRQDNKQKNQMVCKIEKCWEQATGKYCSLHIRLNQSKANEILNGI